jgi:hypothetical protein
LVCCDEVELTVVAGLRKVFVRLALILTCLSAQAQAPERVFDLQIIDGKIAKDFSTLKVNKGDTVRLRFKSDRTGDVHLHAYRLQVRVGPTASPKTSELAFQAHATGKFRFEWHEAKQQGKAPSEGGHHSQALATLEVRPN